MSEDLIRVAGIEEESIVDGPGIRVTIFMQGCKHGCKGCHNPHTWPMDGGKLYSTQELLDTINDSKLATGVTFSGGEPLLQAKQLYELATDIISLGKDLWIYTGYTYEDLLAENNTDKLMLVDLADVLKDGPFVEELRDLDLLFRGSSNQRLLTKKVRQDIRDSLKGKTYFPTQTFDTSYLNGGVEK